MRLVTLVLLLAACGTKNNSEPPTVNVNINPIQATTLSHWLDNVQLKLAMVRVPASATASATFTCNIAGSPTQGAGATWSEAEGALVRTIRGQQLTVIDDKDSQSKVYPVPADLVDEK